ncbi:MAG: hypothetical protein ABWY80_06955 [Acidimicrobiia bacterium]
MTDERQTVATDPVAVPEALIREARRRRRRRWAAVAVAVVALGLVAAALARADSGDRPPVRPDRTQVDEGAASATAQPSVRRFAPAATSALVLSTSGIAGGVAIADLGHGVVADYSSSARPSTAATVTDVAFTRDGLVVWSSWYPTIMFDTATPPATPSPLVREAKLGSEGRRLGTVVGERRVIPTSDGSRVWMLGVGSAPDQGAEQPLELVDVGTGEPVLSMTTPRVVPPGGHHLLGTVGGDALIAVTSNGSGQGGEGWTDIVRVSPAGEWSALSPPAPGALFVTATPNVIVWTSAGREQLLLQSSSGDVRTLPAVAPGLPWSAGTAGHPTIPGSAAPLAALSRDGTRLLIHASARDYSDGRLVVVDLENATTSETLPGAEIGSAFWAADDRTVFAVERQPNGDQLLLAIDPSTGRRTPIPDAIPPGYYLIGAR